MLHQWQSLIFLVAYFRHFAEKKVPSNTVKGTFEKIPKNSPHFEEEDYEIVKNFEGICSCSLSKLSYLISRFYWFVIM
jgi:hypothetical protein